VATLSKEVAMGRKAPIPRCSEQDRRTIEEWVNSRTREYFFISPAKLVREHGSRIYEQSI